MEGNSVVKSMTKKNQKNPSRLSFQAFSMKFNGRIGSMIRCNNSPSLHVCKVRRIYWEKTYFSSICVKNFVHPSIHVYVISSPMHFTRLVIWFLNHLTQLSFHLDTISRHLCWMNERDAHVQ